MGLNPYTVSGYWLSFFCHARAIDNTLFSTEDRAFCLTLPEIGFPSTEQVKTITHNGGTLFYLVTESNEVYIFNVLTGLWTMQ